MKLFLIFSLFTNFCYSQELSSPLDVVAVKKSLATHGPKKTVRNIFSHLPLETELLKGIASGGSDWLAVAAILRSHTDAGASEAVDIALARALPLNAQGVLGLSLGRKVLVFVCSAPFIEPTDEELDAYFTNVESALANVTAPNLATKAVNCRNNINATKQAVTLNPANILKEIDATSIKATAARIESQDALLSKLTQSLLSAEDPDWFKVTAILRPQFSKSAGDKVDKALREALLSKPELVLPYFGKGLAKESICSIEGEKKSASAKFLEYASESLSRIATTKGIGEIATQCLQQMESSFSKLRQKR